MQYFLEKTIKYIFLFGIVFLIFFGDIVEYYLSGRKFKIKYGIISRFLYRLHLYERRNEIKGE